MEGAASKSAAAACKAPESDGHPMLRSQRVAQAMQEVQVTAQFTMNPVQYVDEHVLKYSQTPNLIKKMLVWDHLRPTRHRIDPTFMHVDQYTD